MIRLREINRVVAPLGLALASQATGARVVDGLEVWVSDLTGRFRPVRLAPNPSGVFVGHRLPGISAADLLADNWAALERPLAISVNAAVDRYLPFTATALLPRRGLLSPDRLMNASPPLPWPSLSSPPGSPPEAIAEALPLFPAPAFTGAAPIAEIRVELAHADGSPAAWTLVAATISGRDHFGVTDDRGCALIALSWPPRPRPTLAGSPPAIADYRWPVTMTAWSDRLPADRPPDLAALLAQRNGAPLVLEPRSPSPPDELPTLLFSRPLILPPLILLPT